MSTTQQRIRRLCGDPDPTLDDILDAADASIMNANARLASAVVELSGGREAWHMADMHYGERRRSIRELAEDFDMSVGAVHARVRRCWDTAARFGIIPDDWKHRGRGRPAGRVHYTDADLHENGQLDKRQNARTMGK